MVEVFGRVEKSSTEQNELTTVFRIPAFSGGMAKRRAQGNIRLKGLSNADITGVQQVGEGSIPGQKIFDVTVKSDV